MQFTIKQGMNQDILKSYPDNHFDSIVTDPPYGIEFLGKDWDSNTGAVETWKECFRVLKPGGHILAFSAARTYHKLATNIESVGFEIRDQLMWLYASGFPKAQDIGKAIEKREGKRQTQTTVDIRPEYSVHPKSSCPKCQLTGNGTNWQKCVDSECPQKNPPADNKWAGWKTALKPSHEPIVMARKPFNGSALDNVLKHGTGALNIDATRIPFEDQAEAEADRKWREKWSEHNVGGPTFQGTDINQQRAKKDPLATAKSKIIKKQIKSKLYKDNTMMQGMPETHFIVNEQGRFPSNVIGEIPDYQKYFYCPKVSRAERHVGFEQEPIGHLDMVEEMGGYYVDEKGNKDDSRSDGGNMIWLPHTGKIYTHGLRHEYEQWSNSQNGSIDHILNTKQMLEQMGGYYVDNDGNKNLTGRKSNLAYVPGKGVIQAHGVTNAYEELTKNKKGSLDHIPALPGGIYDIDKGNYIGTKRNAMNVGNNHPTVKPVELMKWLIKLVTPEGGKVLDPFSGSGSTGMACVELGYEYTGCELDEHYVEIATKRIEGWNKHIQPKNNFNELFDEPKLVNKFNELFEDIK